MNEKILIEKMGSKLVIDFPNPSSDIEARQKLIISSVILLINILKADHLKEGTDKESFNYRILESIKSALQSKEKILHNLK